MKKYNAVFISDIHLGTKMSQASALLDFIKTFECEKLYLVGDIIDGWAMSKGFYWPQTHNDVIQKLMRIARKNVQVYYLPGNHDEFLRTFGDHNFGNICLIDNIVHIGINGKKFIVMHGDQFDVVIKNAKWLSHLGTWAYDFSIIINTNINKFRNLLHLKPWSISSWLKYKVKSAVNFIGDYENMLSQYAKSHNADGIICGHIHHPNKREISGITYLNCGDWVETCSAIVENENGEWEIIYWNKK